MGIKGLMGKAYKKAIEPRMVEGSGKNKRVTSKGHMSRAEGVSFLPSFLLFPG